MLTNKYAEGLPGRRYYGGCQYVDIAETLAIERVTKLFGCRFANVQPHSGASANAAAFMALMDARRHLPGPQSRGRRAPDPWLAGQHVGQLVQAGALQRAARRPPHRHGGGAQARARASAQGDHRGRLRLSAHHRLPRLPRDRRRGRRQPDGRHGALRGPRRGRRASVAVPACACRHLDRAQDAARPALGLHPHRRRGAGEEDQLGGVPGPAGRPADARDRRQGGGLRRGAAAVVQGLRQERRRERQGAGRDAEVEGLRHRLRRHRHAPDAGRSAAQAPDRQGRGSSARARLHHLQQERHSLRSREADDHVGRPARHARPAPRAASASPNSGRSAR